MSSREDAITELKATFLTLPVDLFQAVVEGCIVRLDQEHGWTPRARLAFADFVAAAGLLALPEEEEGAGDVGLGEGGGAA